MDKNVKNLIGELKEMVLALHRSAGSLDSTIQCIENETYNVSEEGYLKVLILAQANYRRDIMLIYGDLDEREKLIWQKLIEILKTEP